MTKKMGLMALGLSMVLLSGCGSSGNDDGAADGDTGDTGDNTTLNTPAEATKNIVGTWIEGCRADDNGGSEKGSVTFNAGDTGGFEGSEYSSSDCTGSAVDDWTGSFTYKVGAATTGAGGEDAIELDFVITEDGNSMDYYTMLHFTSADAFIMADDDDETSDADTPETREDIFEGQGTFTRQ